MAATLQEHTHVHQVMTPIHVPLPAQIIQKAPIHVLLQGLTTPREPIHAQPQDQTIPAVATHALPLVQAITTAAPIHARLQGQTILMEITHALHQAHPIVAVHIPVLPQAHQITVEHIHVLPQGVIIPETHTQDHQMKAATLVVVHTPVLLPTIITQVDRILDLRPEEAAQGVVIHQGVVRAEAAILPVVVLHQAVAVVPHQEEVAVHLQEDNF